MFKAVFCMPGNEQILKEFIERILKRKFKTFKIISPELTKNNIYEKGKYLDVLIKTDNLFVNIEVNSHNYNGLSERNFSYIALVYASHIKVGEEYNNDLDFIQINLTVGLGTKMPEISISKVINKETLKLKVRNLEIYDVNLDKINSRCYNEDDEYNFLKMMTASKEELEFLAEKGDLLTNVKSFLIIIFSKKGQISPYPKINLNYIVLLLLHNIFLKIYLILQFWQMFCFFLLPLFLT